MSQENLKEVADLITANTIFTTKAVLTSDEAAQYMGISKSYLYKLTMRGEIPHYKPMGKMCYFNRAELEEWLQSNRIATSTEIADRANQYCMKGGKR
nr:helix-turn-helix domain-containing protein [Bacteroides acidifaciens]